jgi:hypothetical protein
MCPAQYFLEFIIISGRASCFLSGSAKGKNNVPVFAAINHL